MRTPYVPHVFGDRVGQQLRSRAGWLSAAIASSIPWPKKDVWIQYDGDHFFLRGTENGPQPSAPAITVPCNKTEIEPALARVYRFSSALGWFLGGCVDVVDSVQGSHPIGFGAQMRQAFTTVGQAGDRAFNCNYMPIIDAENVRIALAFWREGEHLSGVHDGYAFLSYFKVVESQFQRAPDRVAWFSTNIDLVDGRAAARVAALRADGVDVGRHLYDSGRNAVAHASLGGDIVDPDIPADRRRMSADLVLMRELARRFIARDLQVPTAMSLYDSRDRLTAWDSLVSHESLRILRDGGSPLEPLELEGTRVAVALWPDDPLAGLEDMELHVDAVHEGAVRIVLVNSRRTVVLVFVLDYRHGRIHTQLEQGGYDANTDDEDDVRVHTHFFHSVIGNATVELRVAGLEPVDCEVVIPVNIIPRNPEEAVRDALADYRRRRADPEGEEAAIAPEGG